MAIERREKISAMLRDEPNDAELRYMLAMEHVSEDNDDAAVKCFEEIFAVAPDYAPAYHQAGRALQRLNRFDEARTVILRGVAAARMSGDDHAAGEMQGLLENLLQ
jgi:tetratricopeptide (TPR) repeat protein